MFERRLRKKKHGRLVPRTSRKYLKAINQVREHLRMDTSLMKQVIANNAVSRQGQRDDKRMTQKNRQFCETLVEKLHLRRRFLTSFEVLRAAAQDILDAAVSENRKLTGQERSRVRLLGASACFAALEIGGAPIRVENAMALTCVGEDAQIRIPEKGKKPIKVLIPAELTKNKSEIGPVAFSCRPRCSFRPPSVRRRPGFSNLMLNGVVVDCRTRLCIRRSPFRPAAAFPMAAAKSARP